MNLGELCRFFKEHNLHPKKRLSQNFLIDKNVTEKIVRQADVSADDTVLEIGPGAGALTKVLLETGARVIAVEKDDELARLLPKHPKLDVYAEDIMDFDLGKVPSGAKVVANLPYQITTPVIVKLLEQNFSRIVVMVQDEVARRYSAKPGTSEYGSITIFLQAHSDLSYAFQVKRTCFYPQPKVDSAIIDLIPKPCPYPDDFFTLIRTAFGKRRKMMRGSLKELYPNITEALLTIGLKETARPEELSLAQFDALYKEVTKSSNKG